MKKFLSAFMAIMLCIFGLPFSCGATQSENDDAVNSAAVEEIKSAEESSEETSNYNNTEIMSIGDTASTDEWEFKLISVQFADALTAVSANSGAPVESDDYYLPADVEYKRSSENAKWIDAASGTVYFTFTFSLNYIGTVSQSATPPSDISLIYDNTYTFSKTSVALSDTDEIWSTLIYDFEPLSNSVQGRGYIEGISTQVIEDEESALQLSVNLYGTEFIYGFSVGDATVDETDAYADTDLLEKAEKFGDEDGNISWSEGSFPYFIDMRESWDQLTTEQIQAGIVGTWNVREYTDKPTSERLYTFSSDGTGTYTSALRGEETFYWDAKNGTFVYSLREIDDTMTYSEIRAASDDIWVMYRTKDNMPVCVLTRE